MIKLSLDRFQGEATNTLAPSANTDWDPPDLWDWLESVQGEPEYLFEKLLPADSKIIFTGKPKRAYKSWMAYAMALSAASGKQIGPLIPTNPQGIKVLILAQEGGKAKNRNRFMWLAKSLGIDIQALRASGMLKFSFKEPIKLRDPDWVYKIQRHVQKRDVQLVIIDPLIMFMAGCDENKADQWALIMQALNEISKNGASVIFVHHLKKDQKEIGDIDIDEAIRGTSALAGFYDQHWAFRKKRETQPYNKLTIRSKDDEERFYKVYWDISETAGTANFRMDETDEDGDEIDMDELSNTVLDEMIEGQEYSKRSFQAIAKLSQAETEQLIAEMLGNGLIEKRGRGSYVVKSIDKNTEVA